MPSSGEPPSGPVSIVPIVLSDCTEVSRYLGQLCRLAAGEEVYPDLGLPPPSVQQWMKLDPAKTQLNPRAYTLQRRRLRSCASLPPMMRRSDTIEPVGQSAKRTRAEVDVPRGNTECVTSLGSKYIDLPPPHESPHSTIDNGIEAQRLMTEIAGVADPQPVQSGPPPTNDRYVCKATGAAGASLGTAAVDTATAAAAHRLRTTAQIIGVSPVQTQRTAVELPVDMRELGSSGLSADTAPSPTVFGCNLSVCLKVRDRSPPKPHCHRGPANHHQPGCPGWFMR